MDGRFGIESGARCSVLAIKQMTVKVMATAAAAMPSCLLMVK